MYFVSGAHCFADQDWTTKSGLEKMFGICSDEDDQKNLINLPGYFLFIVCYTELTKVACLFVDDYIQEQKSAHTKLVLCQVANYVTNLITKRDL